MRHGNIGRNLGVTGPHRKAMMRGLTLALIEHEAIKTTTARAKELRWFADHVVTLAKRGDIASRRRIIQILGSTQTYKTGENRIRNAVARLYSEYAPRFKDRTGGYTQIIRFAERRDGDNAEMVLMRYLPDELKAGKGAKGDKAAKAKPKAKEVKAIKAKASEDKVEKKAKTAAPSDKATTTKASDKGKKKE